MALNYTVQPKGTFSKPSPADALQSGVHTALANSSKHKRMVSAPLHLKKESVGRQGRTAYAKTNKAFGQGKPHKVTA